MKILEFIESKLWLKIICYPILALLFVPFLCVGMIRYMIDMPTSPKEKSC